MPRPFLVGVAVATTLLVSACDVAPTDEDRPSAARSAASTSSPPASSAAGYLYSTKEGIRALATFEGDQGTLRVANTTGRGLPPPTLYLLDAWDGAEIEVVATPSRGVAHGATRTFRLSLARSVTDDAIGIVVLVIGNKDMGAFLPPSPQDEGGGGPQ